MVLYKKSKSKIDKFEKEKMNQLEQDLDVESIITFRNLINDEIRAEKLNNPHPKQGWFGWLGSWWGKPAPPKEEIGSPQYEEEEYDEYEDEAYDEEIEEAGRKHVYEAIGYVEEIDELEMPKGYVRFKLDVTFAEIGMELVDITSTSVAKARFDELHTIVSIRNGGIGIEVILFDLAFTDTHSTRSQFKSIIKRSVPTQSPLLKIIVDTQPMARNSDLLLNIEMEQLDVVINPSHIQHIRSFFVVPSNVNLGEVNKSVRASAAAVRDQAAMQLVEALADQSIIELKIRMQAPVVIVPENVYDPETNLILVDLGELIMSTDERNLKREKGKFLLANVQEDDYYDRFNIALTDVRLVQTTNTELKRLSTAKKIGEADPWSNLLTFPVSIEVTVDRCLISNTEDFAVIKVDGTMSPTCFDVSPEKIRRILKIANTMAKLSDTPKSMESALIAMNGAVEIVSGPIAPGMYQFELQDSGILRIAQTGDENAIAIATIDVISEGTTLIDQRTSPTVIISQDQFGIILPYGEEEIVFVFASDDKSLWYRAIHALQLSREPPVPDLEEELEKPVLQEIPEQVERLARKKVNLQLIFALEELSLHFSAATERGTPEQPLVSILFERLVVGVISRTYDNSIFVKLKSFSVMDRSPNVSIKYVLTSRDSDLVSEELYYRKIQSDVDKRDDVLQFDMKQIGNSKSEFYAEGSNLIMSLSIRNLHLLFDPAFVARAMAVGDRFNEVMADVTYSKTTTYSSITTKSTAVMNDHNRDVIRVNAELNQMGLILIDDGKPFARVSLVKVGALYSMKETGMHVEGSIGDLNMVHFFDTDGLYREICGSSPDTNFVQFSFDQGKLAPTKGSTLLPVETMRVFAQVESMQFVFLQRTVNHLQRYFTTGPLMEAIRKKSLEAADTAKETYKKVQQTQPQLVGLDIRLSNTQVTIPMGPLSKEKIDVQLGQLHLTTRLEQSTTDLLRYYSGMHIDCHDLGAKALLKDKRSISMLAVSNLLVIFNRSVDAIVLEDPPVHDYPEILIDIQIPAIEIQMAHSQYQAIFAMLDNNLADKHGAIVIPELPLQIIQSDLLDGVQASSLAEINIESTSDALSSVDEKKVSEQIVRVTVGLQRMNLRLLRGIGYRGKDFDPLLELNMHQLDVEFETRPEKHAQLPSIIAKPIDEGIIVTSSKVHVTLKALDAVDLRYDSRSAFKKFITTLEGNKESFVDFDMKIFETDKIMNVILSNPRFVFELSIIMNCKDFFLNMRPNKKEEDENQAQVVQQVQELPKEAPPPAPPGNMRIMCDLGSPQLVLPVDPTKADARLLIVQVGAKVELSMLETGYESYQVNANITAFVEQSSEQRVNFSVAPIIRPVDINLLMVTKEHAPTDKSLNRDVTINIGPMKSRIAYQDVKMITDIVAGFSVKDDHESVLSEPDVDIEVRSPSYEETLMQFDVTGEYYDRVDQQQEVSMIKKMQVTNTQEAALVDPDEVERQEKAKMIRRRMRGKPRQGDPIVEETITTIFNLAFKCHEGVTVGIVDDARGFDRPLIEILVRDLHVSDTSFSTVQYIEGPIMNITSYTVQKISTKASLNICAYFYNMALAEWEPVLEPFGFSAEFEMKPVWSQLTVEDQPNTIEDKIVVPSMTKVIVGSLANPLLNPIDVLEGDHEITPETDQPTDHTHTHHHLHSQRIEFQYDAIPVMNLNVSQSMITTILATVQLWHDEFTGKRVSKRFDPYTIRNHSGIDLSIYLASQSQDRVVRIAAGTEYGAEWAEIEHTHELQVRQLNVSFSLVTEENVLVSAIVDVRRIGRTFVKFQRGSDIAYAVIEVELLTGRRVITVRGVHKIVNSTTVRCEVQVQDAISDQVINLGEIDPEQSVGVPLNCSGRSTVRVKPVQLEREYKWNAMTLRNAESTLATFLGTPGIPQILKCQPTSPGPLPFNLIARSMLDRNAEGNRSCTIYIRPPISLENLTGVAMTVSFIHKQELQRDSHTVVMETGQRLARGEKKHLYELDLSEGHLFLQPTPKLSTGGGEWLVNEMALVYTTHKDSPLTASTPIYYRTNSNTESRQTSIYFDYSDRGVAYREIVMYSPYWIVNHTGGQLEPREILMNDLKILKKIQRKKASDHKIYSGDFVFGRDQAWVQNIGEETEVPHEPMLFSFQAVDRDKKKIMVRIDDSEFSKSFNVDSVGITGALTCMSADLRYDLGVQVQFAPHKFKRTKMIIFSPRYIIRNETPYALGFIQPQSDIPIKVERNTKRPYYYAEKEVDKPQLLVSPLPRGIPSVNIEFQWSTSHVSITTLGNTFLKVLHTSGNIEYAQILDVQVQEAGGTIYITVQRPMKPPYLVDNKLKEFDIAFAQVDQDQWWDVPHSSRLPYAWDDTTKKQIIRVCVKDQQTGQRFDEYKVNLNKVSAIQSGVKDKKVEKEQDAEKKEEDEVIADVLLRLPNGQAAFMSVVTKGSTRILRITQPQVGQKIPRNTLFSNVTGLFRPSQFVGTLGSYGSNMINGVGSFGKGVVGGVNSVGKGVMGGVGAFGKGVVGAVGSAGKLLPPGLGRWNKQEELIPITTTQVQISEAIVEPQTEEEQVAQNEETEEETGDEFLMYFLASLPGIGVSLIDEKPREVSYIFFGGLYLRYEQTKRNRFAEATLTRLQIDNDTVDSIFPVLLATHEKNGKSFLEVRMCQVLPEPGQEATPLQLFPYFSVLLQEFSVMLDYGFIMVLSGLVEGWTSVISSVEIPEERDRRHEAHVKAVLASVEEPPVISSDAQAQKFYFENLELHPIKSHITFQFVHDLEAEEEHVEEEGVYEDTEKALEVTAERKSSALMIILDSIGVTFANIDDAPLALNAMLLDNVFETQSELIGRLSKHYIRQLVIEMYKLLGSLDMLGNPVGLFSDVTTGVKDFFYEPASAITESPEAFGRSLAKGSVSLVSNSLHGVSNATSKLTGTIGKGVTMLSFDDEYIKKQKQEQRRAPHNVSEGLQAGGKSLFKGVVRGVTGVFTQPYKGAKSDGAPGFFKGLGKGIVGLPVKPVAGALDLISKTSQGMANQAASQERRKRLDNRIRYPRSFRGGTTITDYDYYESYGMHLLTMANHGVLIASGLVPGEKPIFFVKSDPGKRSYVTTYLLTTKSFMKMLDAGRSVSLRWRIELSNIVKLSRDSGAPLVMTVESSGMTPVYSINPKKKHHLHRHLMSAPLFHPSGKMTYKKIICEDEEEQEALTQKLSETMHSVASEQQTI
jgi:hypothetical protein